VAITISGRGVYTKGIARVKVGDKVKVKKGQGSPEAWGGLTDGSVHTVVSILDGGEFVKVEDTDLHWLKDRFEIVERSGLTIAQEYITVSLEFDAIEKRRDAAEQELKRYYDSEEYPLAADLDGQLYIITAPDACFVQKVTVAQ